MLSKLFLAKCTDRSQLPKTHPSGVSPDDWYHNDLLIQNNLFGISFDFFINWSALPATFTPTIWIKRVVKNGIIYSDVSKNIDEVLLTEFGSQYLNRLLDFSFQYQLAVQFLLFNDQLDWNNTASTLLLVTAKKNEIKQHSFLTQEINISTLRNLIQQHSGGKVKVGAKGLTFGTSCLECFLSKTESLYPGDVDLLLLNDYNFPIAILEFKKHTLDTSIDNQQLSTYYPTPDARKYDRLAILRDYLLSFNASNNKLPIINIYYPTSNGFEEGRMELVAGEVGELKALAASNFKLPLKNTHVQILPLIQKTIKAIKWYNGTNFIKRLKVDQGLISMVENYLKTHNLANRGVEDGDYNKQRVGLIGEFTVYKYLFGEYPDLNVKQEGFDGGYDIAYNGRLIDVKTMGRKSFVKPEFVNNFYLLQSHLQSDTIVFCSFHTVENILEICGWLPKAELANRGIYYSAGTKRVRSDGSSFTFRQNNYEVENKNLNDIESLK